MEPPRRKQWMDRMRGKCDGKTNVFPEEQVGRKWEKWLDLNLRTIWT